MASPKRAVCAVVYAVFFLISSHYPVCLFNVFLVLGVRVRVRVRVTEPPTLFPIKVNFLAYPVRFVLVPPYSSIN